MSTQDITKGFDWFAEIGEQLRDTRVAVVCLTPENVVAPPPWMMFESGAIYANRAGNMVCTYLLGVANADVRDPLSKFHTTQANEEETRKLLCDINGLDGGPGSCESTLSRAFGAHWPTLEKHIREIGEMPATEPGTAAPGRDESEKIDEILGVVRRLDQAALDRNKQAHGAMSDGLTTDELMKLVETSAGLQQHARFLRDAEIRWVPRHPERSNEAQD